MTSRSDLSVSVQVVREFPEVGERMRLAYVNLWLAESVSDPEQLQSLGQLEILPRPWDPASCGDAELRREVWRWLDQVVAWINTEYGWDVPGLIPVCWFRHPHLVHDLGAVADQRRKAGLAFTSDALEQWNRECLPAFMERTQGRMGWYCEQGHKDPPGRARLLRYATLEAVAERQAWFETEVREHADPPSDQATDGWLPLQRLLLDLSDRAPDEP